VDFCNLIQQRLKELGREQRDLAAATEVTESYISQLLTRKKAPPATNRTDIYERMNAFLKLPKGQLSAIVDAQRQEEWKKKLADPPAPLYRQVRELVIRKCRAKKQKQMRAIFEKQAFGELERLVTQKLLDLGKRIAKDELQSERWLKSVASLRRQSYQEVHGRIQYLDRPLQGLPDPAHRVLGYRLDHLCHGGPFEPQAVCCSGSPFPICRAAGGRRLAGGAGLR
jgi:transcriptional regulator with XRE-family HTH domain